MDSPPVISIEDHNDDYTIYKVKIPGFWCDDVYAGGQTFQRISVPIYSTKMEVGQPELPVVRGLLGYPIMKDSSSVEVLSSMWQVFDNYLIYPYQQDHLEEGPQPLFQWNQEFYNQDIWYPGDYACLSDEGKLGDILVVNNHVQSFQYNPLQRQLKVASEMLIKVSYEFTGKGGFGSKGEDPSGVHNDLIPLYNSCVWNYERLNRPIGKYGTDYIIICGNNYVSYLIPLQELLSQGQYLCDIVMMGNIYPGPDPKEAALAVYHEINWYYENLGITYVLLVGDVSDTEGTERFNADTMVPIPYWLPGESDDGPPYCRPSDVCYACLGNDDPPNLPPIEYFDQVWMPYWNSSDWYPDIYVGRLTADNGEEVRVQVNKIIDYELHNDRLNNINNISLDGINPKSLNISNTSPWYDTMVFVAHKYDLENEYSYMNDKKNKMNNNNYDIPLPEIKTCWGDYVGISNNTVMNYINSGCNIVNYRGHGSPHRWKEWTGTPDTPWGLYEFFGNPHIRYLNNEHYVVTFNIACSNACIDWHYGTDPYGDTLCDYWMRIPDHPEIYNGAVATVGATRRTYTDYNDYFDSSLFQMMYGTKNDTIMPTEPINLLGVVHYGALVKTYTIFDKIYSKRNILMSIYPYILLGEPSMKIRNKWTEFPKLNINRPEKLIKETPMEVTVYPNPSSGTFTLNYKGNISELNNIKIFDISGRLVKDINISQEDTLKVNINDNTSEKEILLDISDIKDGLYIIGVSDKVYKKLLLLR
jgi:hypothetical protein